MGELQVPLSDHAPPEPERSRPSRKRTREELGLRITVPQNKKARAPVRLQDSTLSAGAMLEESSLAGNTVPVTPEFPSLTTSVSLTDAQHMPRKTSPLPLTPRSTTLPSWPWTPTPKEVSSSFTNYEFESPKHRPCLSQHHYF